MVYELREPIGNLRCDELKSYGWVEVDTEYQGKQIGYPHTFWLFAYHSSAFYIEDALKTCPDLNNYLIK